MSIQINAVSKNFGKLNAVDNITLALEEGKIYGLLGRNGAGKTTLLNLITNRLFPSQGSIQINGLDASGVDKAQGLVYFMSEMTLYPENMRVRDAFKWTKILYGGQMDLDYANNLAAQFGLDTKRGIRKLSTGYTSIFKIIIALSLQIPYILLDEPVLGLDANHRELFYKLLLENYALNPRTIVISTHLIEEVSGVIEQALIIKDGKLIKNESVETLLNSGYTVSGAKAAVESFIRGKRIIGTDTLGGLMTACIEETPDEKSLSDGLTLSPLDLQKLFIRLTNQ